MGSMSSSVRPALEAAVARDGAAVLRAPNG